MGLSLLYLLYIGACGALVMALLVDVLLYMCPHTGGHISAISVISAVYRCVRRASYGPAGGCATIYVSSYWWAYRASYGPAGGCAR